MTTLLRERSSCRDKPSKLWPSNLVLLSFHDSRWCLIQPSLELSCKIRIYQGKARYLWARPAKVNAASEARKDLLFWTPLIHLRRGRRSLTNSHPRATALLQASRANSNRELARSSLISQLSHGKQRALSSLTRSKRFSKSMPNTHQSKRVWMRYTPQWLLARRS